MFFPAKKSVHGYANGIWIGMFKLIIQLILLTDEESYSTVNKILYDNIGKLLNSKLFYN